MKKRISIIVTGLVILACAFCFTACTEDEVNQAINTTSQILDILTSDSNESSQGSGYEAQNQTAVNQTAADNTTASQTNGTAAENAAPQTNETAAENSTAKDNGTAANETAVQNQTTEENTTAANGTGQEQKPQKQEQKPQKQPSQKDYYFRNDKLLSQHYDKHGKDMGFDSKKSYEKAASDVINNPDALHKTEAEDGDTCYYIEETNEFVVLSTDGFIRTYFLPDSGKKYYDKQ